MGTCSGKLLEKEYAGYYSPAVRRGKHKSVVARSNKHPRTRIDNRHGLSIDPHTMQELKAHELTALLKLMNHECKETSMYAYEIIKGISINEFTGAIALAPHAVKKLSTLMGSDSDEVLVSCITALHSLVQQDEDLTTEIYIACIDKLTSILRKDTSDVLCGAISLVGLMAAVDDILCDMIDKDLHEMLADRFHSTNDVVVKRQIFLALHNFMLIKNSEKAMHTKVIKILVETLQMSNDIIDPDIRLSALRILSYISMSGSEYLQKMIGELGGIPTLANLARSTDPLRRNKKIQDFTSIAGMALSGLCCVSSLQEEVVTEWGLDAMLHFLEVNISNISENGAALAVIMALNNLLANSTIRPDLIGNLHLKDLLRCVQQKTTNEDLLEECTEALSKMLPKDFKQAQQTKFEKLCMQHFSPFVRSMMLRKGRPNLLLPSMTPSPNVPPTKNWLLSPEHSSLSPRRALFPRKLNLFFSPKRPSPSPPASRPHFLSSSPSQTQRRHSISAGDKSITSPPPPSTSPRPVVRRKSISVCPTTPPKIRIRQRSNSTPFIAHSPSLLHGQPIGYSSPSKRPRTSISTEKGKSSSSSSSSSSSTYKFNSPITNSFIFCSSPLHPQTLTFSPTSPIPPRPHHPTPRPHHPTPRRFSAQYPSQQTPARAQGPN